MAELTVEQIMQEFVELQPTRGKIRAEYVRLRMREQEWDGFEQLYDRLMANMREKDAQVEQLRAEIRNHWTAWTEQGHACQFCMASTGSSVRAADFPHADGCVVPSALWSYKEAALDGAGGAEKVGE